MDAEEAGDIGCRSAGGGHGDDLGLLVRRKLGLAAAITPLGARRAQAGLRPFADHGARSRAAWLMLHFSVAFAHRLATALCDE